MRHAIIVSLCFLPLAIIYIIMKLLLFLSSGVEESHYVKEEAKKPHGPYVKWEDEENEDD